MEKKFVTTVHTTTMSSTNTGQLISENIGPSTSVSHWLIPRSLEASAPPSMEKMPTAVIMPHIEPSLKCLLAFIRGLPSIFTMHKTTMTSKNQPACVMDAKLPYQDTVLGMSSSAKE